MPSSATRPAAASADIITPIQQHLHHHLLAKTIIALIFVTTCIAAITTTTTTATAAVATSTPPTLNTVNHPTTQSQRRQHSTQRFIDPRLIHLGPRTHPTPDHQRMLETRRKQIQVQDEAQLRQALQTVQQQVEGTSPRRPLQRKVPTFPSASTPPISYAFNKNAPPKDPMDATSDCAPPWPGYPFCESKMQALEKAYNEEPKKYPKLDGSACPFQKYLAREDNDLHIGAVCPDPDWKATDSKLPQPGPDGITEFYVYRVENTQSEWHQHLGDTNAGNAGGCLGYTHTEVLNIHPGNCHRRLHVDVIVVFHVRVRNPGGHFTPFWPYDGGHCGTCENYFRREGFVVGAQNQGNNPRHAYSNGIWYSFPSRGECTEPNGSHNCTYSFRLHKVVPLDRLIRMREYTGFNSSVDWCQVEYRQKTNCVDEEPVHPFWAQACDPRMCSIREQRLATMVAHDEEVKPLPMPKNHARFEFHCMMTGADFKMYIFPYPISWLGVVRESIMDVINTHIVPDDGEPKVIYEEGHADVVIDAIQPQYEISFQMEWMEWRMNFHSRRSFYKAKTFFSHTNKELNSTIWQTTQKHRFWQIYMTEWRTAFTDFCTDPSPCGSHGKCGPDPWVQAQLEKGGDGFQNGDDFVMPHMCHCDEGWAGDFCDRVKTPADEQRAHHNGGGGGTSFENGAGAGGGGAFVLFMVLLVIVGAAAGLYYLRENQHQVSEMWANVGGVIENAMPNVQTTIVNLREAVNNRPQWMRLPGNIVSGATEEEVRPVSGGGGASNSSSTPATAAAKKSTYSKPKPDSPAVAAAASATGKKKRKVKELPDLRGMLPGAKAKKKKKKTKKEKTGAALAAEYHFG